MVLIYVHKSPPRLQYIAAFIFKELLKVPYAITSHAESFKEFDGIKINYSDEKLADDELHISASGLLHQQNIKQQNIEVNECNGNKILFKAPSFNSGKTDEYPFDIFSAAFYLVCRYEEYLPNKKDKYGRYAHTNSLAFNNDFIHLPLINIWVNDFAEFLKTKNNNFKPRPAEFKFIPTYDVDIAYSYLDKGLWRNAGGAARSLATFKFNSLAERIKVLSGKKIDPFDNFKWLDELHTRYELNPIYFFLVAEKNSIYDKNILPHTNAMQQLIKDIAKKYTTALHPSWRSGDDENRLKKEKLILENISALKINCSRRHYLRFTLPAGYRKLIDIGMDDDHSMGFASTNGFRASVASSFYWYDVENDVQTKLRVHPFCYMDSNVIYHQKLSPQDALNEMIYYYNICKKVSGNFITVMHNHFLGSDKKEWKDVYENFFKNIIKAE